MQSGDAFRLHGRGDELSGIDALLTAAAHGAGGALMLEGDAGFGKTSLVRAAMERATARGFTVRAGCAFALELAAPFAVALEVVRAPISELLSSMEPVRTLLEASAATTPDAFLCERLIERVEQLTAVGPVLIVVEDLHWADTGSLRWLRLLAEQAETLALAVLATARPQPSSPVSAHLPLVPRLSLAPLSTTELAALTADRLGAEPGPALRQQLDKCGGTPLLAVALIEAYDAAGALEVADASVELTGGPVHVAGHSALSARLSELDDDARQVVQVAAVLGTAIDLTDVAVVMNRPTTDLLAALDAALRAGLLCTDEAGYAFRHELYRDAVLETMTTPAINALHLDCARVRAARGAPALEVAEHFARGARPGNRDAVAWLSRAAAEVVAHAPRTAMQLLDIALGLCGSSPDPDLLLVRVQALAATGLTAEAEALATSLLRDGLPPQIEATLRRELALSFFEKGRGAECVAEMDRVAALDTEPAHRARVHAEVAFARFGGLDRAGARASAGLAVEEGARSGDVAAVVAGKAVLCWVELLGGEYASSLRLADDIEWLAGQPHSAHAHVYQPWLAAAISRLEAVDHPGADRAIITGRSTADRTGAQWAVPAYDAMAAFLAMREGRYDDAAAAARSALAYLEGHEVFGIAVWCHSFLAQCAVLHGDDRAAVAAIRAAEDNVVAGQAQVGLEQVALAKAMVHEGRGQYEQAVVVLSEIWDLFGLVDIRSGRQQLGPDLARLAAAAGDRDRACSVADELDEFAQVTGLAPHALDARRARAWSEGNPDHALVAVELARGDPRRPVLAAALADAAALLEDAGRPDESQACAVESIELWRALGAPGLAEAVPLARSADRPLGRPVTGLDALTATERRVVELVAAGLPNREIADQLYVSRRTVESHVSAAYRKLGVTSRVELARAVLVP